MKYELKSGRAFDIDESDFEFTSQFKISLICRIDGKGFYVSCCDKVTRKYVGLLHRLLLNCPIGKVVDHIDNNGLNNRRDNLRIATHTQNQMNRRSNVNEICGVWFRLDRKKWAARITVEGKIKSLGHFDTFEEACVARLAAEKLYFGEFARR